VGAHTVNQQESEESDYVRRGTAVMHGYAQATYADTRLAEQKVSKYRKVPSRYFKDGGP
jgi:hypothetical protein